MEGLPTEATRIDPPLAEVGAGRAHQQLVYGRVQPGNAGAVVVARLVAAHPDGEVGRFYGTRLLGFLFGDVFRPYGTEPMGEVRWDREAAEWVQVAGAGS